MTDLKTFKDLRIEEELCEKLDSEVYFPVKEELKGCGRTYSLGIRKENFKGFLAEKFEQLKQESIKWVKEDKEAIGRLHPEDVGTWIISLERWMKRLNITEEDLK